MKRATAGMLIEQIEKLSYMVQALDNRIKAAETTLAAQNPDAHSAYELAVQKNSASDQNHPFVQRMEEILKWIKEDSEKKVKRKAAGR